MQEYHNPMFSAFEWMMAMRYLRARRQEGFISVIAWFSLVGIALGVATLIIVMSVMNGFRQELLERILGINGHLSVYGPVAGQMTDYQPMLKKLVDLDGVISVNPLIEGQVMASAKGVAKGALVRGISAEDLAKRKIVATNIKQGSLANFKGDDVVIIGSRLAQNMGVRVGDKLTLISPKGNITAFGTVPRMRAFKIVGTFEIGMYEYDSGFVFMPLEAAQIYFRMPEGVSNIEVFIKNPDDAPDMGLRVMRELKGQVRVHDWQRANASFFNAIQVERNVMFLILTLIILVAAFNIISSLIMLVKDKGRDIAILRTMGATRGMIMRIFLIAGASVGVIGTMLGFGLGLAFAANIETIRRWIEGLTGTDLFAAEIYFLSRLPAVVDPTEVTTIVLMGLGLSFLATLYPSWRAARIDPAEALRYE
jgi:lipoprotein-releasing system permease protein